MTFDQISSRMISFCIQMTWRKNRDAKNGPRRKKIVTARQVKNAAAAAADTARSRDVDGGAIRIFA